MKMNRNPLAGAALTAIALASVSTAHAQTEGAGQQSAKQEQGLADIVVTAQKRGENLQKTAAAVTAVTSEVLVERGISNLRDAQMVIPAARFQKEGNNTQVFIRGVGSNLDNPQIEQLIAFNFNGVYMPREATSTAFYDLSSVEVLPGPQGTLYGRGAIGGTINVQMRRPGFDNEGNAIIEAGNYELVHGTVAQDFAFSDKLAIRTAIDYTHHKGYFTSGADAADDVSGRLSLLYQPVDGFSAYVWAFGSKKNGTVPNTVNHSPDGYLTKNPYDDLGADRIAKQLAQSLADQGIFLPFALGTPQGEDSAYKIFSTGGEFNLDVGDHMKVTYIPGYTRLKSKPFYWVGSLLFRLPAEIRMQSHELRLSGDTGSVKWLGGLFYYRQTNSGTIETYFSDKDVPFVQYGFDIRRNSLKGVGLFGQATWSVTDALRVTAGGRYSRDKREANGFDPQTRPPGQAPIAPWDYKKSYSYIDWKAGIEYDLAPRVMVYANAQTGHTPGTYNPISQAGLDAGGYDGNVDVKEAKLTAFSGGIKSRFFDNTVQINLEGFYYKYSNLLQQQFNASIPFNPVFNAKKLEIYGLQADLEWRPTSNDRLGGSVGYSRARNKEFVTPNGDDFSGLQPPYAPDWTLLGSYTHTFTISDEGTLDATVSGRYESSWFADYSHTVGTKQQATAKLDASLTYDSGRNWQFSFWGKNLTNRAVLAATAAAGFPGPASGYLEAPRTYGIRLALKY
ncbi:hypothetical protein DM806_17660 [Sphingobium lactosutens]|uniref:TonB-dependent receptor n=1 Tax=Sphingobium lactosutens TaxID=522773 RepID=UPI0015BDBC08|nr:TonB-dependent receptor [Sphingobium lactosutens]NWK97460.1 hypothetical protein [Sphingobium lactosutens]